MRFTVSEPHIRPIARWLQFCAVLIVLMVAIGGITRLTESGLSIVEWKLVSGTLPPLSTEAWQQEFSQYQTSPQFQQVNRDFSLGDFKQIFWLEYLHRLLGRVIGLVFVGGCAYFAARRMARGALLRRLLGRVIGLVFVGGCVYFGARRMARGALLRRLLVLCILVAAQGTVGWIMVASGLQHEPRVEPLKLGLHLLLAFTLFCAVVWTRWQLLAHPRPSIGCRAAITARLTFALLTLQIFMGALVAGLRAGWSYNSYPLMDGEWIPGDLHLLDPWWLNHLESILTVQFQHRMGAIAVACAVLALAASLRKKLAQPHLLMACTAAVFLQFALGVATLLSHVNLWLASAHQLLALLLTWLLLRIIYLTPVDADQHV